MKQIPPHLQVSPYFAFFLIHSSQVGVGIIGFQRIIAKSAGYNAWIGLIIAGVATNVLIWIMYRLLNCAKGDITDIHRELFGKWIGGFINTIIIFYFLMACVSVLRGYIEVVQVWMFPGIQTAVLALLFLILSYYIISAGFRTVAEICFLSVIIPFFIVIGLFLPIKYSHWDNLLPLLNHSFPALLQSAKDSAYTLAGFEVLLMFYPFIKNASSSHRYAQWGVTFTTILYLFSTLFTFAFFSEMQLSQTIWAQLSMFKVISFSFLQRWEYLAVSAYAFVIISNIVLPLWMASRGAKKVFRIQQKYTLFVSLVVVMIVCEMLNDRYTMNTFFNGVAQFDLYFIGVYIPILTGVYLLYKRRKQKHEAG
ncbi:spore germination protein [Ectobacillus sp. JY-23]|uniref:GerAB/ArcD/ProY family transporter n=1 Tax=Ectobacillus sp. JY-23 TaxID=2933872 RepID=UPI001FF679D2|nr:GerAB/ArcD/ProY family transporter [Ectobacillus sp. JY-23]UOY92963.1 spore germination protein [Ectobacillus sp. JY-23]